MACHGLLWLCRNFGGASINRTNMLIQIPLLEIEDCFFSFSLSPQEERITCWFACDVAGSALRLVICPGLVMLGFLWGQLSLELT